MCANETIHGLEFLTDPVIPKDKVLVGDFTSTILSRPIDISKYGVIFASGGKNLGNMILCHKYPNILGPAGICVTIVRDDLVKQPQPTTPSILSWYEAANSKPIPSIYNTPPTYIVYMMGTHHIKFSRP